LLLQHTDLRKGVLDHLGHLVRLRLQVVQVLRGVVPDLAIRISDLDLRVALHADVNRLRISTIHVAALAIVAVSPSNTNESAPSDFAHC